MKKKLMLLDGIRYLLPVVETAHKMGVCGCDVMVSQIAI